MCMQFLLSRVPAACAYHLLLLGGNGALSLLPYRWEMGLRGGDPESRRAGVFRVQNSVPLQGPGWNSSGT